MSFQWSELAPAYAEIFVMTMACVVLLFDLFISERSRDLSFVLCLLTLAGAAVITAVQDHAVPVYAFGGTFVADRVADVLKLFVYAVAATVFLYSRDYLRNNDLLKGEYFVLALFAVLGAMVLISAGNLLTVFLGLELHTLSLYALVAFHRDSPQAAESAMKYFVLGAIASGALLYGFSIIYGVTGTLDLGELGARLATVQQADIGLLFGLAFVLVGVAFKFGAVPFHMWLPDVYHGAPTAVTLFVGSVPKVAAFALAFRLLAEGFAGLHSSWQDMLIVLGVLSLAVGNIVAIAQSNIKRMLAYSTISHIGFILLGLLSGPGGGPVTMGAGDGPAMSGYEAAMYYTLAYVIMTTAAFGMVILLSRRGFEAELLDDFKGLNSRSPWFAGMMLILMFSMAGVPPFLGFYAKVAVFWAVLEAGFAWLAAAAVLFSIIGAFYYLRIVKLMYFDEPEERAALEAAVDMRLVLSLNALLVLALGVFPDGLIELCTRVLA